MQLNFPVKRKRISHRRTELIIIWRTVNHLLEHIKLFWMVLAATLGNTQMQSYVQRYAIKREKHCEKSFLTDWLITILTLKTSSITINLIRRKFLWKVGKQVEKRDFFPFKCLEKNIKTSKGSKKFVHIYVKSSMLVCPANQVFSVK